MTIFGKYRTVVPRY